MKIAAKLFFIFCLISSCRIFSVNAKEPLSLDEIPRHRCVPPATSSWNWSDKELVRHTDHIFIGRLVRKSNSDLPPEIGPDFSSDTGYAFDGRKNKKGTLSVEWTFEVSESLKGNYFKGRNVSFRTLEKTKQFSDPVSDITCFYRAHFDKGKSYLIFFKQFNENASKQISGEKDPYLLKIRELVGN